MFGVSVMGSYKLAIQPWLHATGEAFLTTLMLHMKTSLATSGSSKVGDNTEANLKRLYSEENVCVLADENLQLKHLK